MSIMRSSFWTLKQPVVRRTTKPAPCCHLANDTDLLTPVLSAMAGDNKQVDLWSGDPFTRIDPKFNLVVPWSLHTFPENFMQIGPAGFLVMLLTKKQINKETKKEIARLQYPVPLPGAGNNRVHVWFHHHRHAEVARSSHRVARLPEPSQMILQWSRLLIQINTMSGVCVHSAT